MILDTYREFFEVCGFQVQACASPLEALRHYEAQPESFFAVLTDYTMPELDGVRLMERLGMQGKRRPPPMILLTGVPDLQPVLNAAYRAGAAAVLAKPISLFTLVDVLKRFDDDRDALTAADARRS